MKIITFLLSFLLLISCTKMNKKGRSTQYAPKHFYSEQEMPIAKAILDGDNAELKRLLKNPSVDISKPGKMGSTYLEYAMGFENYEAMEILLKNGANPNVASPRTYIPGSGVQKKPVITTCIESTAYQQYGMKYLRLLVKYGANINDAQSTLPLEKAIDFYRDEMVDYLLKNGADVNATSAFGTNPIIAAAASTQWVLVERLIDLGADPFVEVKKSSVKKEIEYYMKGTKGTKNGNKQLAKLLKRLESMGMEFDYSKSKVDFNM